MRKGLELKNDRLKEREFYSGREKIYPINQFERYQISNATIAMPMSLKVYVNHDHYELIGVEENSSLMVTVCYQQLDEQTNTLRYNLEAFNGNKNIHTLGSGALTEITEIMIDGYKGLVLRKDLGLKGYRTSLYILVNQTLIQVSIQFNERFMNMNEVINKILKSFRFNLPEGPTPALSPCVLKLPTYLEEEEKWNTIDFVQTFFKKSFGLKKFA